MPPFQGRKLAAREKSAVQVQWLLHIYALLSDGHHLVSFDRVIQAMKQTGHDLPRIYKETAEGGLAVLGIKG
jgi:hypothetical protein